MNAFQLSKDFNLQEFECTHPEHRHVQVDETLVDLLQELRDRLGRPIIITSAYRCPERNAQVGGEEDSEHLYGRAADISLKNQQVGYEELRKQAEEIGFTGIGIYEDYAHLDTRKGERAVWGTKI